MFGLFASEGSHMYLSYAGLHSCGADWAQSLTQLTNKLQSFTQSKN